ncbi:MAG: hypothetical protein Q9228_007923, partial [Teloschistes exilis]
GFEGLRTTGNLDTVLGTHNNEVITAFMRDYATMVDKKGLKLLGNTKQSVAEYLDLQEGETVDSLAAMTAVKQRQAQATAQRQEKHAVKRQALHQQKLQGKIEMETVTNADYRTLVDSALSDLEQFEKARRKELDGTTTATKATKEEDGDIFGTFGTTGSARKTYLDGLRRKDKLLPFEMGTLYPTLIMGETVEDAIDTIQAGQDRREDKVNLTDIDKKRLQTWTSQNIAMRKRKQILVNPETECTVSQEMLDRYEEIQALFRGSGEGTTSGVTSEALDMSDLDKNDVKPEERGIFFEKDPMMRSWNQRMAKLGSA